jgi:two-component sensor histidine kinase
VIGEVIEELLSNSIRHGKAKKIELRVITTGDKEIDIIAVDDATIAPTKSLNRAGLGTRIFNLASDGRWSITRVGSSTQFKLRMSIEK